MRSAVKVVPLGVLGFVAALVVACGDANGLLDGSEASGLQDALAAVQSACAAGDTAQAELAAQRFGDRVAALPPGSVDRRLIENLREGAARLDELVPTTCEEAATTTTPTVTTTTTTTPTTTTTTTTEPTTPTEPTVPTEPTTPTTPTVPPDGGGGAGDGDGSGGGAGAGGVGGAGAPAGGTQ